MKKFISVILSLFLTLPACAFSFRHSAHDKAMKNTVKILIKIENEKGKRGEALCSGVIVGPNEILTAGHCVEHKFKILNIWVRDTDGLSQPAFVLKVGKDVDLALLGISVAEKHYAYISNRLRVADEVEAVGMPLDLEWSASFGHVSALNRTFGNKDKGSYIQFDASVNGGNSGGGLWDNHGRLVGIVTAIITPCWFGSWSGLSFAVDMKTIKKFIES